MFFIECHLFLDRTEVGAIRTRGSLFLPQPKTFLWVPLSVKWEYLGIRKPGKVARQFSLQWFELDGSRSL